MMLLYPTSLIIFTGLTLFCVRYKHSDFQRLIAVWFRPLRSSARCRNLTEQKKKETPQTPVVYTKFSTFRHKERQTPKYSASQLVYLNLQKSNFIRVPSGA